MPGAFNFIFVNKNEKRHTKKKHALALLDHQHGDNGARARARERETDRTKTKCPGGGWMGNEKDRFRYKQISEKFSFDNQTRNDKNNKIIAIIKYILCIRFFLLLPLAPAVPFSPSATASQCANCFTFGVLVCVTAITLMILCTSLPFLGARVDHHHDVRRLPRDEGEGKIAPSEKPCKKVADTQWGRI